MFRMRVKVNEALLARLREMPARAKREFKTKLRTELIPELERDLENLAIPGPVSDPFQFGSERSHLWYIIHLRQHPELADDKHWIRRGEIENSFHARISDRIREDLITIFNNHPKAKYVYGPWQVAGHHNTGWDAEAMEARQLLREKVNIRTAQLWRDSVRSAVKGVRNR